MKKIKIMSKKDAIKMSYEPDIDDCILISIQGISEPEAKFNKNPHIKAICRQRFNDVDFGENFCISPDNGDRIIAFVNNHLDDADTIVVHCEAGISRSAGVAAALMLILNGDDSEVFESIKYCPNISCYKTVLASYYGSYNQEAVDEKLRKNIELWQDANKDLFV